MTEKEKMLRGLEYQADDTELSEMLSRMREKMWIYNNTRPTDKESLKKQLKEILGTCPDDVQINQPFRCDYGWNIHVGRAFFANFGLTILDEAPVRIGDNCFIGPNVDIYTACHPLDPESRNRMREWAEPVTIGNSVWIGGKTTILPGVRIGNNVTIGAGSVVTRDIPDNCVAAGNPARIMGPISR